MSPRKPIPPSPEFEAMARGAQFRDRIAVHVKASPEMIFRALEQVSLSDQKLAWVMGEIRFLPLRRGSSLFVSDSKNTHVLSALKRNSTLILYANVPREIITGSAARLRRLVNQMPVWFDSADDFNAFDHPDHQKLFMSLRAAPTGRPGESWLVLEHATRALSSAAERRFRRYWSVIQPMSAFVVRELLRAVAAQAASGRLRDSSDPWQSTFERRMSESSSAAGL